MNVIWPFILITTVTNLSKCIRVQHNVQHQICNVFFWRAYLYKMVLYMYLHDNMPLHTDKSDDVLLKFH